jgi:hypothetical protein
MDQYKKNIKKITVKIKELLDTLHLVSSTPTKHQRGGLRFNHETCNIIRKLHKLMNSCSLKIQEGR